MANCRFYLKKPQAIKDEATKQLDVNAGKRLIKLRFTYNGEQVWFTFGQTINAKDWNERTQRLKKNTHTTADGKYLLNDLLDNLENVCHTTYNREIANGYPHPSVIKAALQKFMDNSRGNNPNGGNSFYGLMGRIISNEIKSKGKNRSANTIKAYTTTKNHLVKFEKEKRYPVSFESINLDFYHAYVSYLQEAKLNPNTIGKDIKNIKSVMNEAIDMKLTANTDFKSKRFAKPSRDTDGIYLNNDDIVQLYNHDFSNNKRLEKVRDMFVFACKVGGLRFADLVNIKTDNVVQTANGYAIRMVTNKTGEPIDIPCDDVAVEIVEKYSTKEGLLFRKITNQKYNEFIKDACKEAKLTAKGRLKSDTSKCIWECVKSHTARRSFATNLYLDGISAYHIMQYTGHRTEKAFLRYIKVTQEQSANVLREHYQKKLQKNLLKVV